MGVGVYIARLRLSFGVATTHGLLDGSLDIAKCLFGLIEQETHFDGFFLECWAVPERFSALGDVVQLALRGELPSKFSPWLLLSTQYKYQNNMMLC
jgi:hypothetical protein